MQLGLATFGDLTSGVSAQQRTRELEEEAELADQLGLDVFAVGEHHRFDFSVSAPAVLLAAITARTERIRLSSAVTVLSSDDPVRVFQQFELFAEKLQLLLEIRAEERVSWEGRHRAALRDAVVWPRPIQDPLPGSRSAARRDRPCAPARWGCRCWWRSSGVSRSGSCP